MSEYTKRPVLEEEVCVHVMSRVVQKRFLIDERGMEEMRRILRTQAAFAGLDVITFCFLKNHFHILLHVDPKKAQTEVTDAELVRRFRALYGSKRSPSLGVDAEGLAVLLDRHSDRAEEVRRKLRARMGDVSVFMRELKTRFTFWYNENFNTVGTFWAERFRSVLVEPGSPALRTVAAYIDVNAVRAGLTEQPQTYRFCGLGEAASNPKAKLAYTWLAKRRVIPLNTDTKAAERVFASYAAHVQRIVTRLENEKNRILNNTPETPSTKKVQEAQANTGYSGKGYAIGSFQWIDQLLAPDGLLGFLNKQTKTKPKAIPDSSLYSAKRWRNT
jgi:REP element-mobilizing transposase RayT